MKSFTKEQWNTYCTKELEIISSILENYDISLDTEQVHIGGERHLFSGKKFVLIGEKDGSPVIIKASRDKNGIREIETERKCRKALDTIEFAAHVFFSPEELLYIKQKGYVISIIAYIEQQSTFIKRPLKDQFFLTLKAFEIQEGVHATTYEHANIIRNLFGIKKTEDYLSSFDTFQKIAKEKNAPSKTYTTLKDSLQTLKDAQSIIECYGGFLVHTDFVPHNVRIKDHTIYLLDHSSISFGNKHEGWARFLNFMTLYNRELESALLYYFQHNRSPLENESLRLMRIYRLGELIAHYTKLLEHTADDLRELTKERISFWTDVLISIQSETLLEESRIEEYKKVRDSLRTSEEKKRQKNLH